MMKNYILTIGMLLFLISCGKSEKETERKNTQEKISYYQKDSLGNKEIENLIFSGLDDREYSEELDLRLVSKVASNLKIKYEDINIDQTSSVSYNDKISFFTITYLAKKAKQNAENEESSNDEEDDYGNYYERKYLFVNKTDGKIIDQELDGNLSYYDNEAGQPSKSYIFKKLIQLNETTNAIGLSTEFGSGSNISLYSEQKFTILALVNNIIIKLLFEYPMRKTQGDSDGSGTFQMESLETAISVSNKKTNGFFDLNVAKTYSLEDEVEEDLEKGIKAKVQPVKYKKEADRIQFNGKKYYFKTDDNYRFLKIY